MYTLITGTTFRDSNITNGVTYYYWVSAVSSSGIGERSAVLNITPAMERTTPSVPQNLNAELQNGTVSLRWAAPSSDGGATITQYLIYRGLTENNLVLIGSATELLYNDTNTIKGVTYYYAVSAVNEEGEGARTGAYQVTVPLSSVPSVPLNLKAEMVNGNVLLSWSAPTSDGGAGITGYKIYRGTSQATLSYITSVTSTSFEDTGRRDGVTYYYTVAAVNEAGDGPSAAPVSITVPRDSVVDSPVGLVAIAGLAVVGVGSVLYLLRHNRLNP
jgi:fibronectin type 3 domain-containing protein